MPPRGAGRRPGTWSTPWTWWRRPPRSRPRTAPGSLDSLEDDLFRFSRIVAGSPQLRDALSDRTAPAESRAGLVRTLLSGKTSDAAVRVAVAATTDVRARPVETALAEAMDVVAARRDRVLALVRIASPLTDAQRDRLRDLLSRAARADDPAEHRGGPVAAGRVPRPRSGRPSWTPPSPAASPRPAAAWPAEHLRPGPTDRPPPGPAAPAGDKENDLMTELSIRPEEIRDALADFVTSYDPAASSREEVGRIISAADGVAHVEGLPSAMANELLRFEDGTVGLALNLDTREIGVIVLGEFAGLEEGQTVKRTGEILSVPVWGRLPQPDRGPQRAPAGRSGGHRHRRAASAGGPGALGDGAPERVRAPADRHQGDRRDDPDRARAAPADHRRPPDREDRDRHRHDHQPARELGVRGPGAAGALRVRRHRAEGVHHRRRACVPGGHRRAGVHDHRGRAPPTPRLASST